MLAISSQQREEYNQQGFVIVRGVFDVARDIEPFKRAYIGFLDSLGEIFLRDTNPDELERYRARSFAERFAVLLGSSSGRVLQHIDPSLSPFMPGLRRRTDLPSAQRPELFHLMRNERLLDHVEGFVGSEITVSPNHHFNLKLGRRHLALAMEMAAHGNRPSPRTAPLWDFHVGHTEVWHSDAAFGLPDAHKSQVINAWIPLTPATLDNGCLLVSPGSHRIEPQRVIRSESVISKRRPLTVEPGDVIFLDNNLAHNALENTTDDDFRWALSFRYLPTGQATGRPFLPEFVARSRIAPERELRDADLWREMWRGALNYLSNHPLSPQQYTPEQAQAITARWRERTANYGDWLNL
jgi:ectoine hydroxylase-related dioxygenase (phytanoyl-CoA dioxygenase family)